MIDNNTFESKEPPKENTKAPDVPNLEVRNFDLNTGLDETADKIATSAPPAGPSLSAGPSSMGPTEVRKEEFPSWSVSEVDGMAIDPLHLARLGSRLDEEDEDYDEEE